MKKPTALVDLDGTVADFAGAMRRDLSALKSPDEPEFVDLDDSKFPPHIKARWNMVKRQPDWWVNLEYLPSGQFIVKTLEEIGYKIHVLTRAPRKLPSAYEQKVRWVMKHLPGKDITLSPRKHMVKGHVLIDDWIDYVEPWLEAHPEGHVIMPAQPWNADYSHDRVLRHVFGKNDEAVKERLQTRKDLFNGY